MYDDKRSKKIIFLSHCILNQNAKPDKWALYPGAITGVIELLLKEGIGIVQMSCPELLYLGLDRQEPKGSRITKEEENNRLRDALSDSDGREVCEFISEANAYQMEEYIKNGFEVLGIIGINATPSCGVDTTWIDGKEERGQGVYINELSNAITQRGLNIPMRGINPEKPEEAVKICAELIGKKEQQNLQAPL